MKQKDLTIIIFAIGLSAILSFFLSGFIVGDPESEPQSVEVVEPISSDFNELDEDYFNQDSINPTRLIKIGDGGGNTSPFRQSEED